MIVIVFLEISRT